MNKINPAQALAIAEADTVTYNNELPTYSELLRELQILARTVDRLSKLPGGSQLRDLTDQARAFIARATGNQ